MDWINANLFYEPAFVFRWRLVPQLDGGFQKQRGVVSGLWPETKDCVMVKSRHSLDATPFLQRSQFVFPCVALAKDGTWQPGPYDGVELMTLHKIADTGGVVVRRKFKAGHTIPAHTHPLANECAYVLSGEWKKADVTYTTGALVFAPKGTKHGPHIARTEVPPSMAR